MNCAAWDLAINLLKLIWEANQEDNFFLPPDDYQVEIEWFKAETAGLKFHYLEDYELEAVDGANQPDLDAALATEVVLAIQTEDQSMPVELSTEDPSQA